MVVTALKLPGRQPSKQKSAAILASAMQEFLAHGYAATSMDRIAKAAGVSKATIYSHFQHKQSLFKALTGEMVEQRFANVFATDDLNANDFSAELMVEQPSNQRLALQLLANRILIAHEDQPEFLSFLRLVIGESGRFPALAQDFVAQVQQTIFQHVCQIFRQLKPAIGRDPELMARIFIGSLMHVILCQDILHGRDAHSIDRQQFAVDLVDLLCGEAPAEIP